MDVVMVELSYSGASTALVMTETSGADAFVNVDTTRTEIVAFADPERLGDGELEAASMPDP